MPQGAAAQLRALPAQVRKNIIAAHKKNGGEAVRYMQQLVAVQKNPSPEDTVRTKTTIGFVTASNAQGVSLTVTAGDDARAIEFINRQPFFYPVVENYFGRWQSRVAKAVNDAGKEVTR